MNRRQFLKAVTVASLIPVLPVSAEQAEVSEDEPLAKALNYVKVAEEAKNHPKYKEGHICDNCMFFKPDQNNGCALFNNRRVEKGGWCLSWAAKPQ